MLLLPRFCDASPGSPKRYAAHIFENAAGETLPYRILLPDGFDPAKRYPLLLFLHGLGESGDDNRRQLKQVAGVFERIQEKHPCFVVLPQCPVKKPGEPWGWAGVHPRDLIMEKPRPEKMGDTLRLVVELIRSLEGKYSIDPKRLYVAGISMGGFGVWDLIAREPTMFAAAVPVCGGGDPRVAEALCETPVWAFHGADDKVVVPEFSRRTIEAMKAQECGPKYTEFPDVGHNSWDPAFATPELLPWLFGQRR